MSEPTLSIVVSKNRVKVLFIHVSTRDKLVNFNIGNSKVPEVSCDCIATVI